MGTDKVIFEGDRTTAHAWSEVTWPEVTGSHVTGRGHDRKNVLCMCNGSCAISSLAFFLGPEVTKSRDRKRPCPVLLFFPVLFSVLFSRIYLFIISFPVIFFRDFSPVIFSRIFYPVLFPRISVLLFLIFLFIQDFQQVTAQHSVQWSSLPRDFLRAWWLINCSFLLIFFMNFLCCCVVVCIDLFCFCFCLSSFCVQYCQFLWIVHSWLLFGFL